MSEQGEIRFDSGSGSVAIRTNQPDVDDDPFNPSLAWLVATQTQGARYVSSAVVESWTVLNAG